MATSVSESMHRRRWLQTTAEAGLAFAALRTGTQAAEETQLPPVRQVTRGPKFHWFSYYDKLQFDRTGRYLLSMEVDFEHRSPGPDDAVKIGMIDLEDGDRWIELDQSRAWCWQQGCMLQWRPGAQHEILWNDRQGSEYVCHVLNVQTGQKRTVPHAIYAVSPDGKWAVSTDFRRLADTRPGYGYNGIPDPHKDVLAPRDSGVWRVDLESGAQELIVSLADMPKLPFPHGETSNAKHWFNHLLINPDGTRVEFLNRWKAADARSHTTRMLTVAPDGSDLRVVDDNGVTSHFIWRDPRHILAWSRYEQPGGFFLFEDKTRGQVEPVLMTGDGHCSYLPGNEWILCDTYPDKNRNQNVYLYHVASRKQVFLGHFLLPREYAGEWRCDTHPRFSPDGQWVTIDSPHAGQGRQVYLIDIRAIVA